MEIRCMGTTRQPCGKLLGYKEPIEDGSVSHGLCRFCLVETEIIMNEEIERIATSDTVKRSQTIL